MKLRHLMKLSLSPLLAQIRNLINTSSICSLCLNSLSDGIGKLFLVVKILADIFKIAFLDNEVVNNVSCFTNGLGRLLIKLIPRSVCGPSQIELV